MIFVLKMSIVLTLFISCIRLVLPYSIKYSDISLSSSDFSDKQLNPKHGPLIGDYYKVNSKDEFTLGDQNGFGPPKIGVYARNFASDILSVIGEQDGNNSGGGDHLVVTLPTLKIEDHIWDGKSITLDCKSEDYPVFWEYHGVGSPKVLVSTHRKAADFYNESTYTYGASVTFSQTDYRQTGEYTCRSVHENSVLGSSAFLFVPGKHLFVANEGTNDTISINAVETNPWVTLPCVVSSNDTAVELLFTSHDGTLQSLPTSESVTFDPTEGFRLKWKGSKSIRNPWGHYFCIGRNTNVHQETVSFKLKPPSKKFTFSSFDIQNIGGNSEEALAFHFNEDNEVVECCSRNANGPYPQMKLTSCTSMSDCYMAAISNPSSCQEGQSPNKCSGDKVMVKVNDNCVGYELAGISEAGILDCMLMGQTMKTNRLQFSFDPDTGFVTKFVPESMETQKILSITREEAPNKNEPNKGIYFCNSNLFFFSHGIKWAIERRSSSSSNIEFLPENSFPSKPSLSVDESQVSKVYCFAPVWDSRNEWRNVSMSVPVPTT